MLEWKMMKDNATYVIRKNLVKTGFAVTRAKDGTIGVALA
jgi:hypothetical protein